MSKNVNAVIKKLPKSRRNKIESRAKDLTKEVFREEVQKYLQTGQSDILTSKEKESLDKVRPKANIGIFDKLFKFFQKADNHA